MDNFVVGDVVQLKSGGLEMTVKEIGEKLVICIWSDGNNLNEKEFPLATLKKGSDKDDTPF